MHVEVARAYDLRMATQDYALELRWQGNNADRASYDGPYRIRIPGKPELVGGADPGLGGDASRYHPEDLFVAALAAGHMLSYLALCARHGVHVVAYTDAAVGRMRLLPDGGRFESVVLRPRVAIAAGDAELARSLHERAHASCFLASSCNVPMTCEPEIARAEPAVPASVVRRDVAIRLADRPGALAELGEVLGGAGVSLEGGGGFVVGDHCIVHFLVGDAERATEAMRAAGLDVVGVRDVLVQRLDQETPGQLGKIARAMADAGVNIECVYSDHDNSLILCVDDLVAGARVSQAWRR